MCGQRAVHSKILRLKISMVAQVFALDAVVGKPQRGSFKILT